MKSQRPRCAAIVIISAVPGIAPTAEAAQDTSAAYRAAECRASTEYFERFVVRTDGCLIFTTGEDPRRGEIQAFKGVLERVGRHEIFRHCDDRPRACRGSTHG